MTYKLSIKVESYILTYKSKSLTHLEKQMVEYSFYIPEIKKKKKLNQCITTVALFNNYNNLYGISISQIVLE